MDEISDHRIITFQSSPRFSGQKEISDLLELSNIRLKEKIIRTSEKDTFERFQKNTIDC